MGIYYLVHEKSANVVSFGCALVADVQGTVHYHVTQRAVLCVRTLEDVKLNENGAECITVAPCTQEEKDLVASYFREKCPRLHVTVL